MTDHDDRKPDPVSYDQLFPGRFVKAGLLLGKPRTLTIARVTMEALPQDDGSTRARGIVGFAETDLQLVLNRTNGECIKAMFGAKVQEWIGHRVTLIPEQARMGRETVDAIRVAGSPELTAPITVEIRLPRRKPQTRTLRPTGKAPAQETTPNA